MHKVASDATGQGLYALIMSLYIQTHTAYILYIQIDRWMCVCIYIYIHIQVEICRERLPILASREPLAETAARHGPGEVPSDAVWAVLERGAPGAESLKVIVLFLGCYGRGSGFRVEEVRKASCSVRLRPPWLEAWSTSASAEPLPGTRPLAKLQFFGAACF